MPEKEWNFMKICVLNGSPKGKYSVTLHTSLYLEKKFTGVEFEFINAGSKIKQYEKDMSEPLAAISRADLVIFSYPVYTFTAPYQLHRFIELLKESCADFAGKFAAQISTSKHFYDVTAHAYVKENVRELGFSYIGGLSADMDDILTEKGRAEAEDFFKYVLFSMENGIADEPLALVCSIPSPYIRSLPALPKKEGFETVIVTNAESDDVSLLDMIEDFRAVYPYESRVINIAEYPFIGGCLGCFNCATDGKCIYKDGFDSFLREKIQTAKAIVYAFTVKDHSMGASFKLYDDRQFCNGHRTVTMGMPMAYIVNGDLEAESNLKTVMEARCDVGHNFFAGAATNAAELEAVSKKTCICA